MGANVGPYAQYIYAVVTHMLDESTIIQEETRLYMFLYLCQKKYQQHSSSTINGLGHMHSKIKFTKCTVDRQNYLNLQKGRQILLYFQDKVGILKYFVDICIR